MCRVQMWNRSYNKFSKYNILIMTKNNRLIKKNQLLLICQGFTFSTAKFWLSDLYNVQWWRGGGWWIRHRILFWAYFVTEEKKDTSRQWIIPYFLIWMHFSKKKVVYKIKFVPTFFENGNTHFWQLILGSNQAGIKDIVCAFYHKSS